MRSHMLTFNLLTSTALVTVLGAITGAQKMMNYIHADVSNLTNTGLDEGTKVDIFGFRVHQEW